MSHPVWVRGLKHNDYYRFSQWEKSHPVWVRGLKLYLVSHAALRRLVAPRVGAWIETCRYWSNILRLAVAPRVGAWIETTKMNILTQLRTSRTPCGCVD